MQSLRVALIADIHANLQAFEGVMQHIAGQSVDTIWNAGDFVGYGANPDEVIRRNRFGHILSIIGNYDQKMLRIHKTDQQKNPKSKLKRFAFEWAYEHTAKENRLYLQSLPDTIRMAFMGWKIMLVHGSPVSPEEHLNIQTPQSRLFELTTPGGVDMILCGHSHQSFCRKAGKTWFINPGSVGRQDDGDYRASYAILEIKKGDFQVQHYRIDYDVEGAVAEMQKNNLPEEFMHMFRQGKNLDDLHIIENN